VAWLVVCGGEGWRHRMAQHRHSCWGEARAGGTSTCPARMPASCVPTPLNQFTQLTYHPVLLPLCAPCSTRAQPLRLFRLLPYPVRGSTHTIAHPFELPFRAARRPVPRSVQGGQARGPSAGRQGALRQGAPAGAPAPWPPPQQHLQAGRGCLQRHHRVNLKQIACGSSTELMR
jgi:hypothetical protein